MRNALRQARQALESWKLCSSRPAPEWGWTPGYRTFAEPIIQRQDFEDQRTEAQAARFRAWLASIRGRRLTLVECGAGTSVPTVRRTCESLARESPGATLIRINLRESRVPAGHIGLALGALEALSALQERGAGEGSPIAGG